MRSLLVVLFLAVLAFGQPKQPEKCILSGVVQDSLSGVPLSKVQVIATPTTAGSTRATYTTSDATGAFTMVEVPAGGYNLTARRNGYLEGKPTSITLEAGQEIKDLKYKLTPFGVIAGTVRDQDGEALADVSVAGYRVRYRDGRRSLSGGDAIRTDDLGQYRITGIGPGRYYVVATPDRQSAREFDEHSPQGHPREVTLAALYPGVTDPASAAQVEVAAGARVTGIDITLPRRAVVSVSGHTSLPPGLSGPSVSLSPAGSDDFEMRGASVDARTQANGDFTFADVPAGSYVVKATARTKLEKPTTDAFDFFFGQADLEGRALVSVSDSPLNNVRIAIAAGAQINGHVQVEGDPQKKLSHTRLNIGGRDDAPNPVVQEDQTFSALLPVGRYFFDRRNGEFVVHKMLVNGRDATDEGLVVSGPGTLTLELLLSKDFALVEGKVVDKDGVPIPGITVVLIPEEKQRWRSDLFEGSKTDQKGMYRIGKVLPGEYKLFAWKDPEEGIWWNPEFLGPYELKGIRITVAAQAKVSQDLNPLN